MSLASAARIAQSALNAVSVETSIVSRNISGANNTTYYSEKTANVISAYGGGAQVRSITNAQNQALFENVLTATSTGATQDALSAGLGQLNQTIGDTSGNTSPSALLSAFTNALQSYEASPTDSSLAQATVNAAQSLTSNLNNASATVANIREQADAQIGTSVSTINSLLSQFHNVNTLIVNDTATGADVTDLEDSRDQILKQLSQQIGITTTTSANNDMSIHTDSGVTLFQETARTVSFTPTNTFTASTNGNPVTVDGVPVTGPTGMPIQSGELAGLATLRDH